jgi:WD40 repeat protein
MGVNDICWGGPNAKALLCSASDDRTLVIWDVETVVIALFIDIDIDIDAFVPNSSPLFGLLGWFE